MKSSIQSIIIFIFLFIFVFVWNNFSNAQTIFKQYQTYNLPPILFIPGLGLHPKDYQTLISNLQADHYVIIPFQPNDTNATNYQLLVLEWTKEISKKIGDKRIIVIGHSVGGSVAAYFCSVDTRCIAGVNMDGSGAFINKIPVPFLYLQADAGGYCDTQCYQGRAAMETVVKKSGSTFIHITGIKHYNFTDLRTQQLKNEDYLGPKDGRNIIYTDIKAFLKNLQKNNVI